MIKNRTLHCYLLCKQFYIIKIMHANKTWNANKIDHHMTKNGSSSINTSGLSYHSPLHKEQYVCMLSNKITYLTHFSVRMY